MCIGQTDFFAEYYERTNVTGIASPSRKDTCDMYPFVSGEFTPAEIYGNASNFGEREIDEAGMGLNFNA